MKPILPLTAAACAFAAAAWLQADPAAPAEQPATPSAAEKEAAAPPAGEVQASPQVTPAAADPTPAAAPRPLGESPRKALEWLVKTQNTDGGWGQGGGWRTNTQAGQAGGRVEGAEVPDPSDVGNTAIALQALLRVGTRLDSGEFAETARKAAEFLCRKVEAADADSLYVTDVRDTQLQVKIGPYVDTFLAAQVLGELKDRMQDPEAEARRARLLDKVVAKIAKHQREDGSFEGNQAWAATLSQGLASKALNGAWRVGAKVDLAALERDQIQNATGLDRATGTVAPAAGGVSDAGVDIYRYASKLGGMNQYAQNNQGRREELQAVAQSASAPAAEKAKAESELKKIDEADKDKAVLLESVAKQAGEQRFVAGFGNNGGEEFLSFMNIGEALHAKGGKPWNEWEERMQKILSGAQHDDGSWSGQHCITGRTFCTSAALLTLTTDRAPQAAAGPVAATGQPVPAK
jgi:hypothetical protein